MARQPVHDLSFGRYRLDIGNVQLWRGDEPIKLRRKTWAVLSYLAHHPGRLVSKQELIENVWKGGCVTSVALRVCIRELRIALGDVTDTRQFIETRGQLGYRFIAPVQGLAAPTDEPPDVGCSVVPDSPLVGRDAELQQLHGWLARVRLGQRQSVFIAAEAGLGKTTLAQAFIAQAQAEHELWVGLGQCVEQYGAGEAYRPVLEALMRLCRGPHGAELVALLSEHAPTWLVQMPGLLSATELDALLPRVNSASQERMLREMAEALDVVTRNRPLILVLEDLHWSDYSTVELLAALARRQEPARLLVLGTYRPADVLINDHPFKNAKQELQLHDRCIELPLASLSVTAIGDYLALRFPWIEPLTPLAQLVHQITDGNSLFMVSIVNAMVAQGAVSRTDDGWIARQSEQELADFARSVPRNLRQTIEQQLGQLNEQQQRLLRVASVAGIEFVTAAVAAGLATPLETLEEQCEELARRWPFVELIGLGEWPDGTLTSRYRFSHALYQNVAYDQLATARRVQLHGLIGERMAQGYGAQTGEIAAELAVHFIHARNPRRAIRYLRQAGKNALQRNTHREAIGYLSQSMELLRSLTDAVERDRQELALILTFAPVLMTARGYSAPEVKQLYERARKLCEQRPQTPQLFHVLVGLWSYSLVRGELQAAHDLAQQIFGSARQTQDSRLLLPAHYAMACTLRSMGEISASDRHAEQGIAIYDPRQHHDLAFVYAGDPGMMCHCLSLSNLWVLGYIDQARQKSRQLFSLAEALNHPHSTMLALGYTAACLHFDRDLVRLSAQTERMIALAEQQYFPFWLAAAHLLRGWVLVQQGAYEAGMAEARQGLLDFETIGIGLYRSYYYAIFVESCRAAGHTQEGLKVIARAFAYVRATGERAYEAELYRLKGELLWQQTKDVKQQSNSEAEVERCFQRARDIARRQTARFFELRATLQLCRLWQSQGKQDRARPLLSTVYDGFTEGFDTPDMQDARDLLGELSRLVPCGDTNSEL